MATKKPQARRTDESVSGWVWLFAAVAFTATIVMAAPNLFTGLMIKNGDGFLRARRAMPYAALGEIHPYPASLLPEPIREDEQSAEQTHPATTESTPTLNRYDFYTLLPGAEVLLSDAELAAITRAEQQRRHRALPAPIEETISAPVAVEDRVRVIHPAAANGLSYATQHTPPVEPLPEKANTRYILQAGSFQTSGEAETTRAQLAMMGLLAQVEPTHINGVTLYRVRMGPYDNASELNDARTRLRRSGVSSMAIRAQ